MLDQVGTATPYLSGYAAARPLWARTWVWVVVTLAVATTAGLLVFGASATAAGGCGSG